jgi:hypothetical protein
VAYRYWYLPQKMKEDLQLAMMRAGAPYGSNPLQVLGGQACQAYGAKYGIPPGSSAQICSELAGAASQVIQQIPQLVGGTLQAAGGGLTYLGQGAGNFLGYVGGGAGSAIQSVAGGVAGGAQALTDAGVYAGVAPMRIASGYVTPIYNGVKTVVNDVAHGIGSTANNIKHFLGSIF